MTKKIVFIFIFTLSSVAFLALFTPFLYKNSKIDSNTPPQIMETPEIIVDYPKPNDVVSSPLRVRGKAKGSWYFEGEFPITLYYGVQDSFVDINAFALGEWMTEDYVDFEVIINFPVPADNDGLLVLNKNNPSDIKEQDASLSIPLRFHN